MSSINTNLGAMVALDTLKGINKNLGMVQNEISTGKSINSAKDNAAIWSISTVMETDVAGFEKIGNSLNLGSATVGVARTGAEDVVSSLQDIRATIIDAQGEGVDREKLQFDIDEAVAQIKSTVSGSQFNGTNLLSGSGEISVLSSLDRTEDGQVSAAKISVNKANLSTTDNRVDVVAGDAGVAAATSTKPEFVEETLEDVKAITITTIADAENYTYEFTVGGEDISVSGASGEDQDDIATKIQAAIEGAGLTGITATVNADNANQIDFDVETGVDATISAIAITDGTDPVPSGDAGGVTVGDAGDQAGLNNTEAAFVSPLDNSTAADATDLKAITITTIADAENYTYEFTVGGEDISVSGASGEDQDDIATKIQAAIEGAGLTGITATVNADNANQIDFDVTAGTDATISAITITDGTDPVLAADDGGVTFGDAGDQDALNVSADPVDKTDVKALTIGTAAAGSVTNSLYEAKIGEQTASYTAKATDTQDDIATGLTAAINALEIEGLTAKVNGTTASQIDFDITGGTNADVTLSQTKVKDGESLAALVGLDKLDVTTDEGAAAALNAIEGFLNSAIDSASEFGSKQKRIDSQISFVSSLGDSLKAGISTLTDANLEEASARLQALQVQQQLGVQALSIANQAPQALLGLFR